MLFRFFFICVMCVALCGAAFAQKATAQRLLTLPAAIERALANNPRLTVAERDIGMAFGRRVQAGVIANPELSLELDDAYGSGLYQGTDSAETTVQLSQLFELPNKREARIAVGSAELESMRWQRTATQLQIVSETALAFINVLGAQNKVAIYETQIASLDRLMPVLQRRVETGASSTAEVSRGQVATDLIRADLIRAKAQLASARRELATLMGKTLPDFPYVAGSLNRIGQPPSFAAIQRRLEDNPQLMRWMAVYAQRRAEYLAARLKVQPDFKVGVGWRHYQDTGDDAVRLGLSMPLPVFDQNQGGQIEAQESLAKTDAERAINKAELALTLGRAYDTLTAARQEVLLLHRTVLPNAQKSLDVINNGYELGQFSLLELLDARASYVQAVLRKQEALTNFHTALATLEGLTGSAIRLSRNVSN